MLTESVANELVFRGSRVPLPPGVSATNTPAGVRLSATRTRDGAALGMILPVGHTTAATARAFLADITRAANG